MGRKKDLGRIEATRHLNALLPPRKQVNTFVMPINGWVKRGEIEA